LRLQFFKNKIMQKLTSNSVVPIVPAQWSGLVPIEDTALFVTDTGGFGTPIIYLNGSYADQSHWKKVVGVLGSEYRHILYDERARGKSNRSKDYSFEACLRDLSAVIEARNIENPILVGWSYGAILAVHWANNNPDKASGIIAIDSAVPYGLTGEASRQRIYKLFNRIKWLLPIASIFGLSARMSAKQHAEINIEINEISANLAPILKSLNCPVQYIMATGMSRGGELHEFEAMRDSINPLLALNSNLRISVKVPSNHENILKKDYKAVADVISAFAKE
jgi:pimeloyl-ACP methyl ester carboxylesterase